MKKFGLVMPTHLYNQERRGLAERAFSSLRKTSNLNLLSEMVVVYKNQEDFDFALRAVGDFATLFQQPDFVRDGEMASAYGFECLFEITEADYAVWIFDDAIYHPEWLNE